ncbi:MAG: cupin domain-containing protein [Candidatus Bathyarchaeia archaeon]
MLGEKLNAYSVASSLDTYSPFDLAELDGEYLVRIAVFKGTFPWHVHRKDEFFLVLEGSFVLETVESKVTLNEGDCVTVKSGLRHRPSCEQKATVLTALHKTIRTSKHDFPEVEDKL